MMHKVRKHSEYKEFDLCVMHIYGSHNSSVYCSAVGVQYHSVSRQAIEALPRTEAWYYIQYLYTN
jgi:hypothetical protein